MSKRKLALEEYSRSSKYRILKNSRTIEYETSSDDEDNNSSSSDYSHSNDSVSDIHESESDDSLYSEKASSIKSG